MIDPVNITNFNRTKAELEEFAVFAVLVAGKTAKTTAERLEIFQKYNVKKLSLMRYINQFGVAHLPNALQIAGIGCFNQKARTLLALANAVLFEGLDLSTCTTDDLEKIPGIGLKTSRFFIMHSRENARIAALDTHILKGLTAAGILGVPKVTPSSPSIYRMFENAFLKIADLEGKTAAKLDLEWWCHYSGNTTLLM